MEKSVEVTFTTHCEEGRQFRNLGNDVDSAEFHNPAQYTDLRLIEGGFLMI
jgi:hypothetical protein